MDNLEIKQKTIQAPRHYARVMAFAVIGLFFVGIGCIVVYTQQQKAYEQNAISGASVATGTSEVPLSAERSNPIRLRIPALSIDTDFVAPLELKADKTVDVPDSYEKVGWYVGGASPGEKGPAVILGHVDSYKGRAVFYSLGQLKEGDEIIINREDGTAATFEVTFLKRYNQDTFPTEEIYGKTEESVIRLVTCSGIYNRSTQKYSQNLVVYGKLVLLE